MNKQDNYNSVVVVPSQVILGDCLEVMRGMADNSVDWVITDPPYGIGKLWVGGKGHGWGKAKEQADVRNEWDVLPSQEYFDEMIRVSKNQIIWGGNHFDLPTSRGWLVWNKPERGFSLAEAELAWTSKDMVIRVCDCPRSEYDREHPTQKPLKLMRWCISKFTQEGETILDPYAGSGTTLRAAKDLNRNYIGIEINPDYKKIIDKRLRQEVLL